MRVSFRHRKERPLRRVLWKLAARRYVYLLMTLGKPKDETNFASRVLPYHNVLWDALRGLLL